MIDRRWTLALSLPLTALALAAPQTADAYARVGRTCSPYPVGF